MSYHPTSTVESVLAITATSTLPRWGMLVRVNATAGNIIVTLPPCANNAAGEIEIIREDSSANTVTIDGNAAETISGTATVTMPVASNMRIRSDGTNAFVVEEAAGQAASPTSQHDAGEGTALAISSTPGVQAHLEGGAGYTIAAGTVPDNWFGTLINTTTEARTFTYSGFSGVFLRDGSTSPPFVPSPVTIPANSAYRAEVTTNGVSWHLNLIPFATSSTTPRNITGSGITATTGLDATVRTVAATGILTGREVLQAGVSATGGALVLVADSGRNGTAWINVIPNGANTVVTTTQTVWRRAITATVNGAAANVNGAASANVDATVAVQFRLTLPANELLNAAPTVTNAALLSWAADGTGWLTPTNTGDMVITATSSLVGTGAFIHAIMTANANVNVDQTAPISTTINSLGITNSSGSFTLPANGTYHFRGSLKYTGTQGAGHATFQFVNITTGAYIGDVGWSQQGAANGDLDAIGYITVGAAPVVIALRSRSNATYAGSAQNAVSTSKTYVAIHRI